MIIVEALLITCLIALLATTSYTDCTSSKIPNKSLIICGSISVVLDSLYYCIWAKDLFFLFGVNLLVLITVGIVFYAYNLWAAGDCKLLFVVGLSIPGRFYTFWNVGWGVSFYLVAFVFSLAFIYIVIESIILGIKDKNLFKFTFGHIDWKKDLALYFSMVGMLSLVRVVILLILPKLIEKAPFIFVAISFILVLIIIHLREKMSVVVIVCLGIASWIVLIVLAILGKYQFRFAGSIFSWITVLVVMALRLLSDKYNYKAIPTKDVREGQILSASTVISFSSSRTQGLPKGTSEDLRSRLTSAEADSVHRWESSSKGQPYVVIVRKIPFAVFISIGTILFIAFEMVMG